MDITYTTEASVRTRWWIGLALYLAGYVAGIAFLWAFWHHRMDTRQLIQEATPVTLSLIVVGLSMLIEAGRERSNTRGFDVRKKDE